MMRIRLSMLILAMTLPALSTIVATAARAAEGPFYRVSGNRLEEDVKAGIAATSKGSFTLENAVSKTIVTCTALQLKSGATINGSNGANAGTSSEGLEFTGCSVSGNGTPCEVEGKKVTTVPITNTLGYSSSTRSGPLLVLFRPESGATFVTVKFKGASCKIASTAIAGTVAGEAYSGGNPVEVGSNEVEAVSEEVKFGKTSKTIFTESGGSLRSTKATLTSFGTASTLEGTAVIEVSGKSWGIFT